MVFILHCKLFSKVVGFLNIFDSSFEKIVQLMVWISCMMIFMLGVQRQKQFYVKYKGLAHVHNRWLPENQLILEAPSLLAKFNQKNQVLILIVVLVFLCLCWIINFMMNGHKVTIISFPLCASVIPLMRSLMFRSESGSKNGLCHITCFKSDQ